MNKELWEQIYNEHAPTCINFVRKLAGGNEELAEDVVHTIFLKLMQQYPDDLTSIRNIHGLINQSSYHLFVDGYRQRVAQLDKKGYESGIDSLNIQDPTNLENTVIKIIRSTALEKAIDRLPDDFREVAILYNQGYSYEEIASRLKIEIGTVKSRINRAKEKLKNDQSLFS